MEFHYHIVVNIIKPISFTKIEEKIKKEFNAEFISLERIGYSYFNNPSTVNLHLLLKNEIEIEKMKERLENCLPNGLEKVHVEKVEEWETFVEKYTPSNEI